MVCLQVKPLSTGRLTLKTLDITKTHAGLVVLSGFGNDHWESAYYLNGKLYASGDSVEDSQSLTKLCKKLARDAGYTWTERRTHIWWRLESFSDIPKTLKAYDRDTLEAYRKLGASTLAELALNYVPSAVADEKEVVRQVYELAGGEHEQFEVWFINYLKTVGSFNKNFEAQVSRYLRLDGQTPADEFKATLADTLLCWRTYLNGVFLASKPLDAVARRALKS